MEALIIAQTVFYSVASLAVIVLGVALAFIVFHLVSLVKNLHKISDDLKEVSEETKEKILEIIEKLSNLPILSFFLKSSKKKEKVKKTEKN